MENKLSNSICELQALLNTAISILETASFDVSDSTKKSDLIFGANKIIASAYEISDKIDDDIQILCKSVGKAADVLN